MGILCIVSGFRNSTKSDLSQSSQHCYFSVIFFAVLDSTNKYLKIVSLKIAGKIGEFAESATVFAESRSICGIHNQIIGPVYS